MLRTRAITRMVRTTSLLTLAGRVLAPRLIQRATTLRIREFTLTRRSQSISGLGIASLPSQNTPRGTPTLASADLARISSHSRECSTTHESDAIRETAGEQNLPLGEKAGKDLRRPPLFSTFVEPCERGGVVAVATVGAVSVTLNGRAATRVPPARVGVRVVCRA